MRKLTYLLITASAMLLLPVGITAYTSLLSENNKSEDGIVHSVLITESIFISDVAAQSKPQPPRAPRNNAPIDAFDNSDADLHSPPGFFDPIEEDNPEDPIPLPGLVWLAIAGGLYGFKKIKDSQEENFEK
ncbi:MAG: hypothetical protein LAT67_08555 [Balneolales bacterium]|nr:hypothetical protein [Balneolales bacterium]